MCVVHIWNFNIQGEQTSEPQIFSIKYVTDRVDGGVIAHIEKITSQSASDNLSELVTCPISLFFIHR